MRAQLVGVTKGYGAQTVLDDVTLTVGSRSRLGLVGPNGVGKSTLLRLLVVSNSRMRDRSLGIR